MATKLEEIEATRDAAHAAAYAAWDNAHDAAWKAAAYAGRAAYAARSARAADTAYYDACDAYYDEIKKTKEQTNV
jgi:hypothetical protein